MTGDFCLNPLESLTEVFGCMPLLPVLRPHCACSAERYRVDSPAA